MVDLEALLRRAGIWMGRAIATLIERELAAVFGDIDDAGSLF